MLCGTQAGVVGIWKRGGWGDLSDRILGHPHSVDAMVALDNDVVRWDVLLLLWLML